MDGTTLFQRLMTDPLLVVERTLEQALEQLVEEEGVSGDAARAPEELIAVALASRLSGMMVPDAPATEGHNHDGLDERQERERLIVTNRALAHALGACECWGGHQDCNRCGGAGSSGWLLPDERLFELYVHPAISAVRAAHARTDEKQPEGVQT
jgi:hypothetical protein